MRMLPAAHICALLAICCCIPSLSQAKSKGMKDTVSGTFNSHQITASDISGDCVKTIDNLSQEPNLQWAVLKQDKPNLGCANGIGPLLQEIAVYALTQDNSLTACAVEPDKNRTYIFRVAKWKTVQSKGQTSAQLVSSTWHVYRYPQFASNKVLVPSLTTGTGDPLIYGAKNALILSLDWFDGQDVGNTFQTQLATMVTQGTPENLADLGTLFSALTGLAGNATTSMSERISYQFTLFAAAVCQDGTPRLPFSLQITGNSQVGDSTKQANPQQPVNGQATSMAAPVSGPAGKGSNGTSTQTPAAGSVSCTGQGGSTPCTVTRTFTSKDREYWDVSGGVATPGVRETGFTFSSTTSTVTAATTTHTDAYAFADFYPFGYFVPKESFVPHFNVGVPVTSKSLYRPYFGLSENLTGWTHLEKSLSLPVAINFFAGACYMKTETLGGASPTTQAAFTADLKWHRVWKPIFGFEIPVSSITSKFGSKSKSSQGSSSSKGQ